MVARLHPSPRGRGWVAIEAEELHYAPLACETHRCHGVREPVEDADPYRDLEGVPGPFLRAPRRPGSRGCCGRWWSPRTSASSMAASALPSVEVAFVFERRILADCSHPQVGASCERAAMDAARSAPVLVLDAGALPAAQLVSAGYRPYARDTPSAAGATPGSSDRHGGDLWR